MAELIPIGTILAVLSNQIIKTAQAANDVVFEKESFKVLGKHLLDIEPVLNELQLRQLNDCTVARQALESLENDVKKANNLVEKYKDRARFYLVVKCRHIVKEIQDVTRDMGKSLAALSLANVEVLSGISDQVHRLQTEMQKAEFEASQSRLRIVDKLNQGLSDQIFDKEFANVMLEDIARAVGVPVEPKEISRELENFKREKEEAANRKERAEVLFLEQVIELLSRADAARDYEEIRNQYFQRLKVIERYDSRDEYLQPFKAFTCCITGTVMDDPVSLCTGTACERAALEDWFRSGKKRDPDTGEILQDFSYRSNIQLRRSIQEWRELNYCLKIRSSHAKLTSKTDSSFEDALDHMIDLVRENSINKEWISIAGLTSIAVSMLDSTLNAAVKIKLLITLKDIIEGHARNKERSGWNMPYCRILSQQSDAIPFLVSLLKSPVTALVEKSEEILAKLCDEGENVIQCAKVNWFRPLVDRIIQGSASVRTSMVRAVVGLELGEEKIKLLGEEGIIPPLLEMVSGSIESKEFSLSALVKLSAFHNNKKHVADAGGVPLILKLFYSSHMPTIIMAKCAEILANLSSSGEGTRFLVDEEGTQLELQPVITHLLALQENLHALDIVRRPSLRALLGICQSEAGLVKAAVLSASGVSVVLPLLDDANQEIRELAINILFLFSQHEPEGVVEYLLKPRRLEALVGFLESCDKNDVQMAAVGLLANLPKSETSLTEKLIELGGLKAIISILKCGKMEAKENALSALFRFTDPTNLKSQRMVVELDVYPLLVDFLKVDSIPANDRAAALIGDLSMRSHELSDESKDPGCWCIFLAQVPICQAHGGVCSVSSTFCLLEANALPDLVQLLGGKVHATAYEAIQTLSTLVREESPQRGANVLHENSAIGPLIEVLSWGSESLKGEALGLLEKVFMSKEMVDLYGIPAKSPLMRLTGRTTYENRHLQRKASHVVLLIERYSRSSMSLTFE